MKSNVTINKVDKSDSNQTKIFDIPSGTFFYGEFEGQNAPYDLFIKGYDQVTRIRDGEQWTVSGGTYMYNVRIVDVEIKTTEK